MQPQRHRGDDDLVGAAGEVGAEGSVRPPPVEVWLLVMSFVTRWELGGTNELQGPSREQNLVNALAGQGAPVGLRAAPIRARWLVTPHLHEKLKSNLVTFLALGGRDSHSRDTLHCGDRVDVDRVDVDRGHSGTVL